LALRSQEFDSASWHKSNIIVTANTTISPDGTSNADSLIENTLNASHETAQGVTTTVISGLSYTCSFYVKANGRDRFRLILANQFAVNTEAFYNLSTGLPYSIGASATATMTNVGNGWYRCTLTSTATLTGTAIIYLTLVSTGTTVTYLGNGTSGVFLWGAQLEQGAYATSYIPTTSASVTRNADQISLLNLQSNGILGSTGLTYFIEFSKKNLPSAAAYPRIGNSSGNDVIGISTSSTQLLSSVRVAGGGFLNTPILSPYNNEMVKVAFSLSGTTLKVFVNGTLVQTTTASLSSIYDRLDAATSLDKEQKYKSIVLWKTPLTDAECIQLTTL
jgi:hypothetical protein